MSDSCKPGGQRWGFRNTDFFFIFWESLGVVSLMMSQGGPVFALECHPLPTHSYILLLKLISAQARLPGWPL